MFLFAKRRGIRKRREMTEEPKFLVPIISDHVKNY